MDEVTLTRAIGSLTGGIGASMVTDYRSSGGMVGAVEDPHRAVLQVVLRGKAVGERVEHLMGLLEEVLLRAKMDNKKRAVELLKESKVRKQAAVVSGGHSYAATRLHAKYVVWSVVWWCNVVM